MEGLGAVTAPRRAMAAEAMTLASMTLKAVDPPIAIGRVAQCDPEQAASFELNADLGHFDLGS